MAVGLRNLQALVGLRFAKAFGRAYGPCFFLGVGYVSVLSYSRRAGKKIDALLETLAVWAEPPLGSTELTEAVQKKTRLSDVCRFNDHEIGKLNKAVGNLARQAVTEHAGLRRSRFFVWTIDLPQYEGTRLPAAIGAPSQGELGHKAHVLHRHHRRSS